MEASHTFEGIKVYGSHLLQTYLLMLSAFQVREWSLKHGGRLGSSYGEDEP